MIIDKLIKLDNKNKAKDKETSQKILNLFSELETEVKKHDKSFVLQTL